MALQTQNIRQAAQAEMLSQPTLETKSDQEQARPPPIALFQEAFSLLKPKFNVQTEKSTRVFFPQHCVRNCYHLLQKDQTAAGRVLGLYGNSTCSLFDPGSDQQTEVNQELKRLLKRASLV